MIKQQPFTEKDLKPLGKPITIKARDRGIQATNSVFVTDVIRVKGNIDDFGQFVMDEMSLKLSELANRDLVEYLGNNDLQLLLDFAPKEFRQQFLC